MCPRRLAALALLTLGAVEASDDSAVEVLMSGRLTETCINKIAAEEGKLGKDVVKEIASAKGWRSASGGQISDQWATSTWDDIQKESESQRAACFGIQTKDTSPIQMYLDLFQKNLLSASVQVVLCLTWTLAGGALLWNGPAAWRVTFTCFMGALGAFFARHEALAWDLTPNIVQEVVWMLQLGLAMMLAVHVGYEGSQVVFGMLLGVLSAYGLGAWARQIDLVLPGFTVLWYCLGGLAGFMSYTVIRPLMLALLASLAGGWLVVASLGALTSRLWAAATGGSASVPDHIWGSPLADTPVVHAAGDLLGVGQHYAIPWHCGCVTFAAVLRMATRNDWLAIVVLVASVASELVSTLACQGALLPASSCSDVRHFNWQWMLVGDVLWVGLSSAAAYRQLQILADWEVNSFWRRLAPCGVPEQEEDEDLDNVNVLGAAGGPDGHGPGGAPRGLQSAPEPESWPPLEAGLAAHWDYARRTLEQAWDTMQGQDGVRRVAMEGCCSGAAQRSRPGGDSRVRDARLAGRGLVWS